MDSYRGKTQGLKLGAVECDIKDAVFETMVSDNLEIKSELKVDGTVTMNNGIETSHLQSNTNNPLEVRSHINLLSNNISGASTINGYSLQTMNTQINNNSTNISSNTSRITTAEGKITTNTSDIASNTSRITSAEGKITTNTTDISALTTRVTSAEGKITTNTTDISSLNTRVTTAEGKITTNTSDISALTTRVTSAEGKITTNTTDISSLDTRVTSAEGKITTNTADILTKLNKSGDTMTGTLNMGANDIKVSSIKPSVGSSITTKITDFIIDAENLGDCRLILKADSLNDDDGKNPMIIFQQDGTLQEGAVFLGDNELNISSSVSLKPGIKFRVDSVDNGWLTAPERMSITSTGAVRLGVVDTVNTSSGGLSVFGAANDVGAYTSGTGNDTIYNQIYIRYPNCAASTGSTAYGWILGNQVQTPSSIDLDFYFNVQRQGTITQAAYISESTPLTQMNFTGQHRSMPMFEFKSELIGMIVESCGHYMDLLKLNEECSQKKCISINDSLPMVKLCNTRKSKKVFGVISDKEDDDRRSFASGNFVSLYNKEQGDHRLFLNSLGEGAIWVCNSNGNLENGDYIQSSILQGYGEKQDDGLLHNYTVAKITMDCDFNPALERVKIYKGYDEIKQEIIWEYKKDDNGNDIFQEEYTCITLDNGYKVAFVGCTYHCG
jgi:peptidoglycan hydrolase CwlO-like protein